MAMASWYQNTYYISSNHNCFFFSLLASARQGVAWTPGRHLFPSPHQRGWLRGEAPDRQAGGAEGAASKVQRADVEGLCGLRGQGDPVLPETGGAGERANQETAPCLPLQRSKRNQAGEFRTKNYCVNYYYFLKSSQFPQNFQRFFRHRFLRLLLPPDG